MYRSLICSKLDNTRVAKEQQSVFYPLKTGSCNSIPKYVVVQNSTSDVYHLLVPVFIASCSEAYCVQNDSEDQAQIQRHQNSHERIESE